MTQNGTTKLFALSAVFAAMIPAMQANAAGYQVNEHSAAGLGRAFAGEAAIADDASVIARNPAAMSFLEGRTFTSAVSYVKPEVEVETATGKDKAVADEALVPVFYYVAPVNDKLSYGFGAFTNYGVTTDYSASSGVTPAGDLSKIESVNLNPSVSYKLMDNLSVGFGLDAVFIKAQLTSSTSNSLTMMDVKGDNWGYGWNAGIFWEPVKGTRVGASYRSSIKTTLDGDAESDTFVGQEHPTYPGVYLPNLNDDGSVDLELPAIAEVSVFHQLDDRLAVHASYMHIGWTSFKEIVVELDNGAEVVDPQNYNNSSRWAVGTTYNYDAAWTLRAGYAYDNSPVGNADRSFRIPDSDRQWFSFGANYQLNKQQNIDFGYAFVKADKVHIADEETGIEGDVTNGNAHIISIQYNQTF